MKKKFKKQRLYKQTIALLFLGLIILFFISNRELFDLMIAGDIEAFRSHVFGEFSSVYFLMLIVMIIQNSFTVIPLILVITVNIALFGFVNGFLWSWVTSLIGSAVVFFGVRYLVSDLVLKRFESDLLTKVERSGFSYVFQGRVFPFVPTSLINILAGMSSVRFKSFFIATLIGNFLYFFALALLPAGILSAKLNEYEIGMILFVLIFSFFVFKKYYRKKKQQELVKAKMVKRIDK